MGYAGAGVFNGDVHFEPLTKVYDGRPITLFLTHLGLILYMGFLEWRALLPRRAPPAWAWQRHDRAASEPQES